MTTPDKPRISEIIVVEGRYDKIKVTSAVSATVIETGGFSVFKNSELIELLRLLSRERGIIIFTDSDGAGFQIRNRVKSALPPDKVRHAYIPDIAGKEKRKKTPSKSGRLGVEGMTNDVIIAALRRAGATFVSDGDAPDVLKKPVTRGDLYDDGLFGTENSAEKRVRFMEMLGLPKLLSVTGLIDVLNTVMDYNEYKQKIDMMEKSN